MRPLTARMAAVLSLAWGVVIGGTFGCALPYLLGDWHLHHVGSG
jgi:hypothetical protein